MSETSVQPRQKRGPGRPPDTSGDQTKASILDAARRLIASHGYHDTTTRMIAEEVGVTPAALHHYFGRKRDLAISAWRDAMAREFERLNAVVDAQDSLLAKIHALLDIGYLDSVQDRDQSIFISAIREEARRIDELGEILEDTRMAEMIRRIVTDGVRTGEVGQAQAAALRGAIAAVLLGTTLLENELTGRRVEAMVDGCKQLFEGTLLKGAPGRSR